MGPNQGEQGTAPGKRAHTGARRSIVAGQPTARPRSVLFGRGRAEPRRLHCAAASLRTVVAPCETLRLDPSSGNIHQFEAVRARRLAPSTTTRPAASTASASIGASRSAGIAALSSGAELWRR